MWKIEWDFFKIGMFGFIDVLERLNYKSLLDLGLTVYPTTAKFFNANLKNKYIDDMVFLHNLC